MTRLLPFLILIAVTIFTLVVVAQSDRDEVRHLPRWLWFVVVLLLPVVGLLAWWIAGRPLSQPEDGDGPTRWPVQPVAPDDDPDFLRGL